MIVINLKEFERKIYSQNSEDGVLQKLFDLIQPTQKFYVEFGVENGQECNTRYLRENGWRGLLMDGSNENKDIDLHRHFITRENILDLFEQHNVPTNFDLLSIDIDYNDFWIWQQILTRYTAKVVVIEYNASHDFNEDKVVPYIPDCSWNGSNYFGASILSLTKLANKFDYSLVYAEKCGVNLFFVHNFEIERLKEFDVMFANLNSVEKLYMSANYHNRGKGHPVDLHNRQYVSSGL